MNLDEVNWKFIDETGAFRLENPHHTNHLYFPLVNEAGMMSCVTPTLHGDIKTGQNTFLTPPVSIDDLHNTRSARNFWIRIPGQGVWSAAGNSARQHAARFSDQQDRVALEAGFLWHRLTRQFSDLDMRADITSLVPAGHNHVELMQVVLTNTGDNPLTFTSTAAVPIFARSADNLRDHRHVTSLLHRIDINRFGVLVKPTLSFDERGHLPNETTYAVLGCWQERLPPAAIFPVLHDFIGEGGNLTWPESVVMQKGDPAVPGTRLAGYEAVGGLRFPETSLLPGNSTSYLLILAVWYDHIDPEELVEEYGGPGKFEQAWQDTVGFWEGKLNKVSLHTGNARFDGWMKWVSVQPILRRLFGNSFLPYHDYGRGGRGWRDLWQDLLALMLMEPVNVRELLLANFAGVRMDGSNATIIGHAPGEFKADRNDIPRVWMDHAAWPFLTTKLYLDLFGDLPFLLEDQTYFKDCWVYRARQIDPDWETEQGTLQRTASGDPYRGSILEHLLIQHLVQFFNVGDHNNIRLEGADWNDGLDMAPNKGESVAFTALYAGNLRQLAALIRLLAESGISEIMLAKELVLLLDTLAQNIDYHDPAGKRAHLERYFAQCRHQVSGIQVRIPSEELALDLERKADWIAAHLRQREWIENPDSSGWFNGYYDDNGIAVEGQHPSGVRMTLTGQVFPIMGKIATREQLEKMVRAADTLLFDETVGGYRLNTDFREVKQNLGRAFGFAYGTKENGAMFSHMATMYAYSLYQSGLVREGFKVLDTIFSHSQRFAVSRMYPGIPEYFDNRGRGMYPYLTGSASWYLLTMVTQVFGIRGVMGDLLFSPRLLERQFDASGQASINFVFAGQQCKAVFENPDRLDFDQVCPGAVRLNGQDIPFQSVEEGALISRALIAGLPGDQDHRFEIKLLPAKTG